MTDGSDDNNGSDGSHEKDTNSPSDGSYEKDTNSPSYGSHEKDTNSTSAPAGEEILIDYVDTHQQVVSPTEKEPKILKDVKKGNKYLTQGSSSKKVKRVTVECESRLM